MRDYATYSPEDNKLRLYVGRIPRPEYDKLRAGGWTSTPKQDCDFVATWTPGRVLSCLEYADLIEDEDQGVEDRAADRAERFGEYRDKRTDEATGAADRYEAGPSAHGYQSAARGERAARRFDAIGSRACDAWSKAEYWQRRTAGVIAHALYVSSPAVRMGRIKTIEAEQRKQAGNIADYRKVFATWERIAAVEDEAEKTILATRLAGGGTCSGYIYHHPRPESETSWEKENGASLYCLLKREKDPITGSEACALYFKTAIVPDSEKWEASSFRQWELHFAHRLAYENQMLEAQGGRAAFVEMEAGGFLGSFQIRKVNRSPVTTRTISVQVLAPTSSNYDRKGKAYGESNPRPMTLHTITVERMSADAYRSPTDEERAAFVALKKQEKADAPKGAPCPLVNPDDDDAERLQAAWNERARDRHADAVKLGKYYGEFIPAKLTRLNQAIYSANSTGSYALAETRGLCADMELEPRNSNMYEEKSKERAEARGPAVCKVRITSGGSHYYTPSSLIVIEDKPQKALPAAVWSVRAVPAPAADSFATV